MSVSTQSPTGRKTRRDLRWRVVDIVVASVLALKERGTTFRYPEERPIVG